MPWRVAPAWPDSPPPCTLTLMSNVSAWLVSSRGCLTIMIEVWRPKNSWMSLPLTVIWPVPFFMKTRATLLLRRPVPLFHSPIIVGSLQFQRLRLLGGVRMLRAAVHLQLLDHGVAERALGQHALDGLLECAAGMLGLHVAEVGFTDAAREARVAVILLVELLRAGDPELGGIDDDDEVAGVDVRRVDGLVLAAQTECCFAGNTSEHLVGGVNHKPLVRHVSGFCAERFHVSFRGGLRILFRGRCLSCEDLLGGVSGRCPSGWVPAVSAAGPFGCAAEPKILRRIKHLPQARAPAAVPSADVQ